MSWPEALAYSIAAICSTIVLLAVVAVVVKRGEQRKYDEDRRAARQRLEHLRANGRADE